jgi:hypothetical protein
VACRGFSNPEDVYRIEFPADDDNFPNYKVIKNRHWAIEDANEYPSFQNPMYFCTHVQTWLGVPLISPSTGELFGMITIDSKEDNAYTTRDAKVASWFAKKASAFLIESALGPAALTLSTKRESLHKIIKEWASNTPALLSDWQDDLGAANGIVEICKNIFMVEDCSIFFLRRKYIEDKIEPIKVLHLVASTAIPESEFKKHESLVTGKPRDGLTGYAVFNNRTLNYGFSEIERSPYRGSYLGHLHHFPSKRSKQVMITTLRNSSGAPIGAMKVENKLGWPTEIRFPYIEQVLFEVFALLTGLIIEEIRQKYYVDRNISNIHHLRAIVSEAVVKPLSALLREGSSNEGQPKDILKDIQDIQGAISYIASTLDYALFDPQNELILENEGVVPALVEFIGSLQEGFPNLTKLCEHIRFLSPQVRDDLPLIVKVAFYNIGREALLNIIKHSGIEKVDEGSATIKFGSTGSTYYLAIRDNGIGFDYEEAFARHQCFGLRDMEQQINSIRDINISKDVGVSIVTSLKNGTLVSAWWTPSHLWRFIYGDND